MASCGREEMEFCVFLLYSIAEAAGLTVPDVYARLTGSGILDEYIIPFYDVLHTLGGRYLVNDITDMMRERGVLPGLSRGGIWESGRGEEGDWSKGQLELIYRQGLEPRIIGEIAEQKAIGIREAMDIYYRSKLAEQISRGAYGIQYLDYHVLAEDLMENESALFETLA